MRNRFRHAISAIVTAVGMGGLLAAIHHQAAGQTPGPQGTAPQSRRTADGRPDFSGIWEANNTANWDLQTHAARPMVAQPGFVANSVVLAAPVVALGSIGWVPGGLGVVDGEDIPYQPWAAARKTENLEHGLDRDPE